jgi:hypothetical protein
VSEHCRVPKAATQKSAGAFGVIKKNQTAASRIAIITEENDPASDPVHNFLSSVFYVSCGNNVKRL